MRTAVNNLDLDDLGRPEFNRMRQAALGYDTEVFFHCEMQPFEFPDLAHPRITLSVLVVCVAQSGDQRDAHHCGVQIAGALSKVIYCPTSSASTKAIALRVTPLAVAAIVAPISYRRIFRHGAIHGR